MHPLMIFFIILAIAVVATGITGFALNKENKAKVPLEITAGAIIGFGLFVLLIFFGGSMFRRRF